MAVIENYISNYIEHNPLKMFNNVSYKSTKDIASTGDINSVKEPTIITESNWSNVYLLIPFFLFAAFYSYRNVSKSILNIWPVVLVAVIAMVLIRQAMVKKGTGEVAVYADNDKLVIKKQTFEWKDITNAYIMTDNAGRTPDKFLLLELNGTTINKIYINQLGVSSQKLAAIIQHYKNN
jgi:hypothetical protein